MMILWFLCSALLGMGAFYITAHVMRYPLKASRKTMAVLSRRTVQSKGSISLIKLTLSKKLAGCIKQSSYSKERISAVLNSAGITVSPEEYVANAVISGMLMLAIIPLALLIFPPLSIAVVLLAIAVFFKEYRSAFEINEKMKKEVEAELLRFASMMKEGLKKSRDILVMLEDYRKTSNGALAKELTITITDMRTGNYETGLTRFSARVNSPLVNDIVRGLLGTLRGDDQTGYFETLVGKLKELEVQRLRKEVMKRPSKIKVYSFLMVLCFMLIYLVVMGVELVNSFGKLF